MLHVPATDFVGVAVDTPAPPRPPLACWDYVRLRRESAGLSIDDVATAISPRIATRSDTAAAVRLFEGPGYKLNRSDRGMAALRRLAAVFPMDIAVYLQLAHDAPESHPPVCRGCGASYWDPVRGGVLGHMEWAAPGICTGCAPDQADAA